MRVRSGRTSLGTQEEENAAAEHEQRSEGHTNSERSTFRSREQATVTRRWWPDLERRCRRRRTPWQRRLGRSNYDPSCRRGSRRENWRG